MRGSRTLTPPSPARWRSCNNSAAAQGHQDQQRAAGSGRHRQDRGRGPRARGFRGHLLRRRHRRHLCLRRAGAAHGRPLHRKGGRLLVVNPACTLSASYLEISVAVVRKLHTLMYWLHCPDALGIQLEPQELHISRKLQNLCPASLPPPAGCADSMDARLLHVKAADGVRTCVVSKPTSAACGCCRRTSTATAWCSGKSPRERCPSGGSCETSRSVSAPTRGSIDPTSRCHGCG